MILTVDITLTRGDCRCRLPPHLEMQIAPHTRHCRWHEMYDTITLFWGPGPDHVYYWTAVIWYERYRGPDPNSIPVKRARRR